ncbi:Hypothetical protein ZOSMA_55G00230 [Zostera marina]|uniref:Uncharacterized protein n=1 Tax=Zostera marina TaxID=29655 RepID=A0A0K9NWE8_ZOSMR|nr:Hypothetical protein ZOSMA_55G00230 [Zostera marina]
MPKISPKALLSRTRFTKDITYQNLPAGVVGSVIVSSPLMVASDGLRATVVAVRSDHLLSSNFSSLNRNLKGFTVKLSLHQPQRVRHPPWTQVPRGATRVESATRRAALPPSVSATRSTLSVSMPVDPLHVPQFYSSPLIVARWNVATEFGREVSLHNPEWKTLQSIPCSTLLEGAIATNLNSLLPLKVAYAQVTYLVSENANYHSEIDRVDAKCDALALKLEATMKYCEDLSLKLQERLEADLED